MKTKKLFSIFFIAFALMFFINISNCNTYASSKSSYSAYTNKAITLREKTSNSSTAIEELDFCTRVTVIGTKGNWVEIKTASGNVGYTREYKISTIKPYKAYTNKNIDLRETASNSSNIVEKVEFCKKITVIGTKGKWVKIRTASGNIGYTKKTKISTTKPYKAYTNKNIDLMEKTSYSSNVIEKVEFCKKVTVIGSKGSWVEIRTASGNVGYTKKTKISTTKPYKNKKGYVKTLTVTYLKSSQDDNASTVASVKAGEIVNIISSSNGWYSVKKSNGTTGFIRKKYIATKSVNSYKLLATYTTYSSGSPSGRNYNMARASSKITGTILKPGQEFNWANVVGPCNKSTGYKPATVIVGNSYQVGYGGGVCQVSTTLCGCVQKLGITPTEKHKHTAAVSYLNGDGVEAAVSYGYLNFRFTNTTSNTILLEYYTNGGRVIAAAYKVN